MRKRTVIALFTAAVLVAGLLVALNLHAASGDANARLHSRVKLVDAAGVGVVPHLAGGLVTRQVDVTGGAAWSAAGTAIPAGTVHLLVYTNQATYLVWNTTATQLTGAANGVIVTPGTTHRLECYGATYLHAKRVGGSDATIQWSTVARVADE